MCIAESSLALDTPQYKSRSRLLFRACEKQTNNVDSKFEVRLVSNVGKGLPIPFNIHHQVLCPPQPPQITEERTSRLDNINCRQISKSSCNEAIRCLARINEGGMRPRHRILAKEVKSTEERTQPKHFNTRVHLKYNKILICDNQTNNDEI